jgi:methylmalonyl-CoA carboxyltransferase large subunit
VNELTPLELAALVTKLRAEVRDLTERVALLEQHTAAPATVAAPSPAVPAASPSEASEDDLLVLAAAVAAFLGVRARIRQVRLIQSTAWAQVGRATVHASHRVH